MKLNKLLLASSLLVLSALAQADMDAAIIQDISDVDISVASGSNDSTSNGDYYGYNNSSSSSTYSGGKAVTASIDQTCKSVECIATISQTVSGGSVSVVGQGSAITADISHV